MRNRSNSGVRLDYYQRLVYKTILKHQDPVTGLFGGTVTHNHAWVRDNVYSIMAVWGLAQAYKKNADLDEDRAKTYELEQAVVKLMRGLLRCMMMQVDKLEKFKHTQSPKDALHAKYSSKTGKPVVGDDDWGHLQIDATSLYILTLAQMTASGLQIVYTLDEVAYIQNLVFYIESAYRTPDYGIWERGDKTNHGLPELNSSSIGMAKAALEAINELDLFGARGGPTSIIHVLPDEAQQCQAILHSMLPKESNSKEIDAALITVISYPAFAVDDVRLISETRRRIQQQLEGKYGFCRFLRDGHKTAKEDPSRLYYEPWELQMFEKIECQWPMFFAYFLLDGLFNGNEEQVIKYRDLLDSVLKKRDDGVLMMPELYTVPADKVDEEYRNPNSQKRVAIGKLPQMWGESMLILSRLILENFLSPGELDPLNRRLVSEPKPDIVVQVVILAENLKIQEHLLEHGIDVQTSAEVCPIQVYPARVLTQIYSLLGKNKRLGLTGRPSNEIGLLATSKLYMLQDQILAFIPQFVDQHQFYLPLDTEFLVDIFQNDVEFLSRNWSMLGRPVFLFPILGTMLDMGQHLPAALVATIKKLQSGYIAGTRVHMGKLSDFLSTSCVTKLSFVSDDPLQDEYVASITEGLYHGSCARPKLLSYKKGKKGRRFPAKSSVAGIVRRTRSIQIDPEHIPDGSSCSNPSSPGSAAEDSHDEQHLKIHLKSGHFVEDPISPVGSPKMSHKAIFHRDSYQDNISITELIEQLNNTEVLQEQADIVHFLYTEKGLDWDTEVGGKTCSVRELLVELYEKAGHWKQWWLVRHTAGMLKKRVEDLALAATDLLVRQKLLSIGLPPHREKEISCPLPPDELATIIFDACGADLSTASLTQEILIYLAMFIRTEPKLFHEMLRLRVGLIIQVMASELSRTFKCSGDEASDHLLNLSPFELKTLLHHILSGKEFVISSDEQHTLKKRQESKSVSGSTLTGAGALTLEVPHNISRRKSSVGSFESLSPFVLMERRKSSVCADLFSPSMADRRMSSAVISGTPAVSLNQSVYDGAEEDNIMMDRQGQWIRRRRLDGALNRVPVGFYPRVWHFLNTFGSGVSVEGEHLPQNLTKEMTSGELKFALRVEMALNRIPQPEYRQLMVEALMVVTLISENEWKHDFCNVIHIDKMVHEANNLYIQDQKMPAAVALECEAAAGICHHFYDSAPSGRYGTMSYLCRALANILGVPAGSTDSIECAIS
ncbi:Phosphorylase b kinase regulatory subunit alpha, liver isoform [Mizuhopecten yessoensis]|uniref:Phosphorylase b kinase regulatory subunit n=1 Tax=Mizuhopecten yessoensis TaxID=6573 RepID=A0A210Q661_MIZYE|nr:Phosphorylase b kinase regulatory subunit alpha, liver isoform [Mizuhopecten yessoensis]